MPFRWTKEEGCGRQHLALCVGRTGMTMDWGAAFRYNIKIILVFGIGYPKVYFQVSKEKYIYIIWYHSLS